MVEQRVYLCNNVHMALKNVLLTLLAREQQTGYDIVKTFDSAVGYFWSASHQQVYRELNKMTDTGLVKFTSVQQGDKPDKKVYGITANGKRELQEWLEQPVVKTRSKNLLLVKLLNLDHGNVELILQELERVLTETQAQLEVYREIEKQHYSASVVSGLALNDLALYMALRSGITSAESYIEWLHETRSTINSKAG